MVPSRILACMVPRTVRSKLPFLVESMIVFATSTYLTVKVIVRFTDEPA